MIWDNPATSLVTGHVSWQELRSSPDQCHPIASSRIKLPDLGQLLHSLFDANYGWSPPEKVILITYWIEPIKDERGTLFIHSFPPICLAQKGLDSHHFPSRIKRCKT
jgi:hypothetical protein